MVADAIAVATAGHERLGTMESYEGQNEPGAVERVGKLVVEGWQVRYFLVDWDNWEQGRRVREIPPEPLEEGVASGVQPLAEEASAFVVFSLETLREVSDEGCHQLHAHHCGLREHLVGLGGGSPVLIEQELRMRLVQVLAAVVVMGLVREAVIPKIKQFSSVMILHFY